MPNECSREKQTEAANGGVTKGIVKIFAKFTESLFQ